MKIDVILPTYNRSELLKRALDNALKARIPKEIVVRFLVVDNNSCDETHHVIEQYIQLNKSTIIYLFEPQQGRHHALNTGIAYSNADIIAFFDDDEQISPEWFITIVEAFQDSIVDYIAGPVHPDWAGKPVPSWMPSYGYGGVLGIIDNGKESQVYSSPNFHAMPTGGNFAIRKRVLDSCGPYSPDFMYHEDLYMYQQLIKIGAYGIYLPRLEVYHFIQEKRLQKSYFRYWAYNEGLNKGKLARIDLANKRSFLGAPLYQWKQLAESIVRLLSWKSKNSARFKAELDLRQFFGFYLAKNIKFITAEYIDRA